MIVHVWKLFLFHYCHIHTFTRVHTYELLPRFNSYKKRSLSNPLKVKVGRPQDDV